MKLIEPIDTALSVEGLRKSYGPREVLSGIDLAARPGEVVAVLGPNGAGKSTLIKCILGLVRPDGGSLSVCGLPVSRDVQYRDLLGYMPQQPSFPPNLTGLDLVALFRQLRGRTGGALEELTRRLHLDADLERPVRTLSGGTRQKISAMLALLFEPRLLILDEPTAGLDPVAGSALKDLVRRRADEGCSVLMTSHVAADLDGICDRIVFLLDGHVHYDGSLAEVRERAGENRLDRAIAHMMTQEVA